MHNMLSININAHKKVKLISSDFTGITMPSKTQMLKILVLFFIKCIRNNEHFVVGAFNRRFNLVNPQDDYYITFNEGHSPRSCMECASILVTGIQDLHVFGCWQKGSCFYVQKCVYQPTNSSQTASGNSLPLLYISSGETLVQRASWEITNLASGECLFNNTFLNESVMV